MILPVPTVRFAAALIAIAGACRSGIAPPETDASAPARPPLPPGLFGESEGSRRECPAPADTLASLEQRIGARLDREAAEAAAGLASLDAQRTALEQAAAGIVSRRRAAETGRAGAAGDPDAGATATDVRAVVAREVDREATEFLAGLVPLAITTAAGGSDPAAGPPGTSSKTLPRSSRAQVGGPREGRWILPILRTTARLRDRFERVSTAVADVAALEGGLRRAEAAIQLSRDRWVACSRDASASPASVPDAGYGLSRADLASAAAAGRADACAAAAADASVLLEALESSRPAGCPAPPASHVCDPPAVAPWSIEALDALDASDPDGDRRAIELLDGLVGPPADGPDAAP